MSGGAGRRRRLFWRVYLTFVATVVSVAALAALALVALRERYDAAWAEAVEATLEERTPALAAALADPAARERELRGLGAALDLRVALRGLEGEHLAGDPDTRPLRNLRPRQRRRLERGLPVVTRDRLGEPLVAAAIGEGVVLVADTGDRGERQARWLVAALLAGLVVLALSVGLLTRSLTRRLAALEDGAARIARGELGHRVPAPPGGDEIDRLGHAFNDMAQQLGELLRGQRALLANVSHELKTPIARMRVLAELLAERAEALPDPDHPAVARMRRGAGELDEDLAEMETLVQDLLTSGRLELSGPHAPGLHRTRVDLGPLADKLAGRFAARAEVDPPGLAVAGDALLLERLLSNLLANARKACPSGQVTLRASARAGAVELAVEDEGPGIPPAERARVFEAFYRIDDARAREQGGSGLGLYLCRQIARAHGGTIAAEDRAEGRPGARLVVRLPPAAA